EMLAEKTVEWPRRVRQRCDGSVVSHGPDGLLALHRHGSDDHLHFFAGVAKAALQAGEVVVVERRNRSAGSLQGNVVDQFCVRSKVAEVAVKFIAFDQAKALEVEQDHLAGPEASAANDGVGVHVSKADFGSGDDQSRVGDYEAAGTKAVAIEGGAQQASVGEDQR